MIDWKDFRAHPQKYYDALTRRGPKFDRLLKELRATSITALTDRQTELEQLQAKVNAASALIPGLAAKEKRLKIAELKPISDRISELKKLRTGTPSLDLPNVPKDDVPDGENETGNVIMREVGGRKSIAHPRDYLALAEPLGLIDIRRAGKVSGSRFGYLLGAVAEMEFALIAYAQSILLAEGFIMVIPPVMIKEENMAAMGYLHGGGESETYHLEKDRLYLVGTSEQSIGPMHRDEVFAMQDLPRRYLSFSTCFRREAGSYGQDTKGILRVHQFDKLEMFSITAPERSDDEHRWLLALEEKLWQGLDIPYRVVNLCTGDLSWPSARTYDIEAWMPGQGKYREVSSASTTTDYQARALHIKLNRDGKNEYVHMLNGTAFSGRPLIAIIENYQNSDGSITVPKVLQPYMHGRQKIGS